MTQTDLSKCLELERASVGHVVDQLERMVLAERRAAKGDRRVWELHLLPRAIEILPPLRAEADMISARLLPLILPTEIHAMRTLMPKMSGYLDSGPEDNNRHT